MEPREFNDGTLELVAERFRALGEPMRLRILNRLRLGEKSVGELVEEVGATQANVSRHLGLLRRQGLVERQKHGVRVFYRISDPMLFELCELVCRSVETTVGATRDKLRRPRVSPPARRSRRPG